jgi:TPR repeat protein
MTSSNKNYDLAMQYSRSQKHSLGFKYFELAAQEGHILAQNELGCMYQEGRGVKQDYAKAKKYFELAANEGNVLSQISLGHMY